MGQAGGRESRADRLIIHVDMDAFFASVEIRDNPSLEGKPVIIGARPGERGVVSTCSYEARKYGVHSAMNISEARKLCPCGIFLRPDHEKYVRVSRQLHEIWDPYATVSEPMALDETYLDVTETAGTFEMAREIAHEIKVRTRKELGLTCSVGLSYCMAAAKTASEERKPDGYFEIRTPEDFVALVSERDVGQLYSVGRSTREKLEGMGIEKVCDIMDNRDEVEAALGQHGRFLVLLAQGIDTREVTSYNPEEAKSVSREVTFQKDVPDYLMLMDVLLLLSMSITKRASGFGLRGTGVSLKVTYADRRTVTRNRSELVLSGPMDIAHAAWSMLDELGRSPVRRIGVGLTGLSKGRSRQITLDSVDGGSSPEEELEHHLRRMSRRYGIDFIENREAMLQSDVLYALIEQMRVKNVFLARMNSNSHSE